MSENNATNNTGTKVRPDPVADAEKQAPKGFRFEHAGDTISGRVTGFSSFTHEEFGTSPVIHLDTSHGEDTVYVLGRVLLSRLQDLRPQVGDEIRISYTGDSRSKDGNRMRLFDVVSLTSPF